MSTTYTIDRLCNLESFTKEVMEFFEKEAPTITELFDGKLNYKNADLLHIAKNSHFLICRRNGEIRGYLIAALLSTPLDRKKRILQQVSFYVKPNSGRTAYHLFHKFIDIGNNEADHVITMLTSKSNIKPSSLEKLGFKELETLYRLEINK